MTLDDRLGATYLGDGRCWFVTPKGHGFLSLGVNHMDLAALKYPDNIHIYRERYGGDNDRFIREGIAEPLRQWGFNTISWTQELVGGVWAKPGSILRHSPEWTQRQFHIADLPYVYNLKFADIEDFNTHIHYPDVFDKEFEDWADYVLADFGPREIDAVDDAVNHAADALAWWLDHGLDAAASRFNRRDSGPPGAD